MFTTTPTEAKPAEMVAASSCAFGEACSWPTQSFVAKFREEFTGKSKKPTPPPMPPEYNSDELVGHEAIETIHDARTNSPMAPAATR